MIFILNQNLTQVQAPVMPKGQLPLLNFFFQNLFSLFIRGIQLERKICTLKSHKFYIIMLKCPLTSISRSTFVNFKVILFIFDFLQGYLLFPKTLKKNQMKENKR